jgi:hypothetical protein
MLPRGKSVKGAGYGAIVVHRNQWTFEPLSPESAVHIRPLSVIRFAPSMPQDSHAYLFALAGLEGTLAVCMSTQPKPLLIVDNFCEKSVLDICWCVVVHTPYLKIFLIKFSIPLLFVQESAIGFLVVLHQRRSRLVRQASAGRIRHFGHEKQY